MLTFAARSSPMTGTRVSESPATSMKKDPQAVVLVHEADCTKGRYVKESQRVAADQCANCQLYRGQAADANEGCSTYAGKVVASKRSTKGLFERSPGSEHARDRAVPLARRSGVKGLRFESPAVAVHRSIHWSTR